MLPPSLSPNKFEPLNKITKKWNGSSSSRLHGPSSSPLPYPWRRTKCRPLKLAWPFCEWKVHLMFCFALLCFAVFCSVLLCFALLSSVLGLLGCLGQVWALLTVQQFVSCVGPACSACSIVLLVDPRLYKHAIHKHTRVYLSVCVSVCGRVELD